MTQKTISNFKRYFKDWNSVYFYLNRAIRNSDIRDILYRLIRIVMPTSNVPAPNPAELSRLDKDGVIVWNEFLDAGKLNKIREYLLTKPVYDWHDHMRGIQSHTPLNMNDIKITRPMKLQYFDEDIVQCKEIIEVANRPEILSLVSAYLGCKPTISLMSSWWTKAGAGPSEKFYDDMFHRDVADYRFLKLFVYLTDVTEKTGAHCFIRGSHKFKKFTERRVFSDEEINQNVNKQDQLVFTGKKGTGFLENTWGLHRSRPCEEGERLVLHIMYNLAAIDAGSPRQPIAKNIYGVDQYSNRVYLY